MSMQWCVSRKGSFYTPRCSSFALYRFGSKWFIYFERECHLRVPSMIYLVLSSIFGGKKEGLKRLTPLMKELIANNENVEDQPVSAYFFLEDITSKRLTPAHLCPIFGASGTSGRTGGPSPPSDAGDEHELRKHTYIVRMLAFTHV